MTNSAGTQNSPAEGIRAYPSPAHPWPEPKLHLWKLSSPSRPCWVQRTTPDRAKGQPGSGRHSGRPAGTRAWVPTLLPPHRSGWVGSPRSSSDPATESPCQSAEPCPLWGLRFPGRTLPALPCLSPSLPTVWGTDLHPGPTSPAPAPLPQPPEAPTGFWRLTPGD